MLKINASNSQRFFYSDGILNRRIFDNVREIVSNSLNNYDQGKIIFAEKPKD